MSQSLAQVINEALRAVSYKDSDDNDRFRSAVLDLSKDYPDEGSFIFSVTDDKFLEICYRVTTNEVACVNGIKNSASLYLHNGRNHTDREYADKIANAVVDGFQLFKYGETARERNIGEQHKEERPIKAIKKNSTIINEDIQRSNERILDSTNADLTTSRTRLLHVNRKSLIIAILALGICLCSVVGGIVYQNHQSENYEEIQRAYQLQEPLAPHFSSNIPSKLGVGGQSKLEVDGMQEGDSISWESSNPEHVSVDEEGNVTAKALGSATITAHLEVYGKDLEHTIEVNTLTINNGYNEREIEIDEGYGEYLHVDGTDTTEIVWTTYDDSVLYLYDKSDSKKPEKASMIAKKNGTVCVIAKKSGTAKVEAQVDGQTISTVITVLPK